MRMQRTDRGAAAVEFALVLPLLLLLVFGIIDFGRAYASQIALTQGAREGVRLLALKGSVADVEARLPTTAVAPLVPGATDPVSVGSAVTCGSATDAQLVLRQDFSYITPLPGLAVAFGGSAWDTSVVMEGEAVMRCEG